MEMFSETSAMAPSLGVGDFQVLHTVRKGRSWGHFWVMLRQQGATGWG